MYIETTPRSFLTIFFRQKLKIFAVALLILASGAAYIHYATPLYESHSSILVKFGPDAKPDVSTNNHGSADGSSNDHHEIIESDIQILQSHDLLSQIVIEFGAQELYPQFAQIKSTKESKIEGAISRLVKSDLIVKAAPSSNVIEIKLLNQNPHIAERFVRRLVEQFVARQSDVYNKPQIDFLADQLKRAADELGSSQQKLKEFKAQTGLSSLEEEQSGLLQAKTETQSAALQNISETQAKLNELKLREAELLTTYRSDSFPAKRLRESILVTEKQLRQQQGEFKASTEASIEIKNSSRQAKSTPNETNSLAEHIHDLGNRISELEKQRNQYNDLQRQVKINEENYKTYQERIEEARANSVLNEQKITRISVLDEPVVAERPSSPNKMIILLLCSLAAIIGGLGIAIIFESIDQRFTTPEQLEKILKVTVLATFPLVQKR